MPPPLPSPSKQRSKRKATAVRRKSPSENSWKKRKIKGRGHGQGGGQQEDPSTSYPDEQDGDVYVKYPRRSGRVTNLPEGGYQEISEDEAEGAELAENINDNTTAQSIETESASSFAPGMDRPNSPSNTPIPTNRDGVDRMEVDALSPGPSRAGINLEIEEEEKPKPMLQLTYQGFDIYGHCLCIVVEPWPPLRPTLKTPVPSTVPRPLSVAPPGVIPIANSNRAKTPLFLPDDTERDRSETPAPFQDRRGLPLETISHDTTYYADSDDSDEGGMMEFSQVLSAAGEFRMGPAGDNEDMDDVGAMFFGDADEAREL